MMRRLLVIILLSMPLSILAQEEMPEQEAEELRQAIGEAGSSSLEFVRAIERHLAKYPQSPEKADLERTLLRAVIELNDNRRIVLYGERVLAREAGDTRTLERVTRALLASEDRGSSERALKYAVRFEEAVKALEKQRPASRRAQAGFQEEYDRALGRALVFRARAEGGLGRIEDAAAASQRAFETYPTAESAREVSRWMARVGNLDAAVRWLADAFTIEDPRNDPAARAKDRQRMGELYRKLKGSESGLGDVILAAYDRTSALVAERERRRRALDPNAGLSEPSEFTLRGLDGSRLELSSLKGKVAVLDFWATWCGPCRTQHPLYEAVKQRFKDDAAVVFLSVNTDEDEADVMPFVEEHKWSKRVYFHEGLAEALRISSIPTTVILGKSGEVVTRMNGFLPDRFVDMLTNRIKDALAE